MSEFTLPLKSHVCSNGMHAPISVPGMVSRHLYDLWWFSTWRQSYPSVEEAQSHALAAASNSAETACILFGLGDVIVPRFVGSYPKGVG